MTVLTLNLSSVGQLTDEAFYNLCRTNPDLKFECTEDGKLIIVSPTGGETGIRNRRITQRLGNWTDEDNSGVSFDSSTCFKLPSGAKRSPDAAWIILERWESLTPEQRQKFPPLAPDFVIELRSPTDELDSLQAKMREYMSNGVRLGWLIDPILRRVEVYRLGEEVEVLESPSSLSGEDVLPGFVLDLDRIL
ncbi:Uma2 family endonuclease [Gloeothece verrucosa]|uniref:Uma2 family endonuclease n=1 Tax=Gloeothece verrucosa TaxID=2546359 RepID=UPI000306F7E7|nr:Uma2 family endonuclease [Gloeothece verrucosa]